MFEWCDRGRDAPGCPTGSDGRDGREDGCVQSVSTAGRCSGSVGCTCDLVPVRLEVRNQLVLPNAQIIVEQVQQLLLHQVDLGQRKESTVLLPVHVFGGRVVQVFGGADEDGEKDAMSGASHAGRDGG